ncbi:hypothetical protein C1H46_008705 [Malus baccata]|uniref:Uncharacterized protein n=1 Tax=Malus baccata TaxID=106549 RepID=A0A540N3P5_MALBA|nr:hypothetical protein C1H46_008705 [Malus baccata]
MEEEGPGIALLGLKAQGPPLQVQLGCGDITIRGKQPLRKAPGAAVDREGWCNIARCITTLTPTDSETAHRK